MIPWIDRCRELFEHADSSALDLSVRTGLSCPPGCGACCLSPDVETTAAEMMPMAAALLDAGRDGWALERIERFAAAGERRCALYEPDPGDARRGRCGAYLHRPLVCRLFGFSGRRDRDARPELITCAVMRAAEPDVVDRARAEVRGGAPAPMMADHARAVAAERPGDGVRQVPINAALRHALEAEHLVRRLAHLEAGEDSRPGPDEEQPRRGPGSRRNRRRRAA